MVMFFRLNDQIRGIDQDNFVHVTKISRKENSLRNSQVFDLTSWGTIVNVRLAISTTTARRRQPSVYLGLRVQMERANPVASKTSRSACPIVVTALTGKRSRMVGLLSQEPRTTGS